MSSDPESDAEGLRRVRLEARVEGTRETERALRARDLERLLGVGDAGRLAFLPRAG